MSRSTGSFPPNTDQLRQSKHTDTQTANRICSQLDTSPFFWLSRVTRGSGSAAALRRLERRVGVAGPRPHPNLSNPFKTPFRMICNEEEGGGAAATKNAIRALRNQHAGLQPLPDFKPQSDPNPTPTSLSPHSFLPNTYFFMALHACSLVDTYICLQYSGVCFRYQLDVARIDPTSYKVDRNDSEGDLPRVLDGVVSPSKRWQPTWNITSM